LILLTQSHRLKAAARGREQQHQAESNTDQAIKNRSVTEDDFLSTVLYES